MPEAWSLAQRLAECARSEASINTTDELIGRARRWLEAGDHKELVRNLVILSDLLCHLFLTTT
jgi:hypothetical protein